MDILAALFGTLYLAFILFGKTPDPQPVPLHEFVGQMVENLETACTRAHIRLGHAPSVFLEAHCNQQAWEAARDILKGKGHRKLEILPMPGTIKPPRNPAGPGKNPA